MTNVCTPALHGAPAPLPAPERFATLQTGLDLLDQGVSIFDRDLRLVAWNRAYVELLDFPPGMAWFGAPFEEFIAFNARRGDYGPGEPQAQVAERMAAARSFVRHAIDRVRPNGRVLHIRGEPLPGGGFVTLYSDVTERRQAEDIIRRDQQQLAALVEQRAAELDLGEQRMRLVMDAVPALVGWFDHQRVYRYLNRGYRDWFGLDAEGAPPAGARAFVGEAAYAAVRPHLQRALQGTAQSFEYERIDAHGARRQVRTTLAPERGADGQVAGCFEFSFDITEQRRTQALVARADRLASLSHLTGGLSHDFNNILAVVIGNLEALQNAHAGDAALAEYVSPALDAARRGADLVQALLGFARRQPLEAAAVHVGALLDTVARLLRRSLPATLQLSIDAGPAPLWTWIDATLLEQAMINLVLNARDACSLRGQIRLRACAVQLDAATATPLQLSPGECVCIEVQDDGAGMDAHTLAHLFEPFFTTKRPGKGTGLGMAVVYGFVKQSGGAIDVKSRPGQGSTVTLWLPAAREPAPIVPPPADAAPEPSSQGGLALLVEDDADVRRVVRRNLLELGYAVLEAESGAEALALLQHTPPLALVLSDRVMPGAVDGVAVLQAAQADARAEALVLMTGHVAPDLVLPPGLPLLRKPFTTEQLARSILEGTQR